MAAVTVCGWGANKTLDPLSPMFALSPSLQAAPEAVKFVSVWYLGKTLHHQLRRIATIMFKGKRKKKTCFFTSFESPVLHFIFFKGHFCLKC